MAQGIPTSNILQPGAISLAGGANRALVSLLQLLTPQYYKKYVERYGNEDFTWWLSTYGGMEEVFNQQYFWFEAYGKLMTSVISVNAVSAPAAGASVTLTLAASNHFNAGTESPLRVSETVRIASSNIEGVITAVNTGTPFAFTFTVAPKILTQAFVSAGSANLLAGEVLLFGGDMDAGEASQQINPLIHLDNKFLNTITEMRDTWTATDLAEMTQVFYESGVSGDSPVSQAGTSYFTYKGMVKTNTRYKNYVEAKLMRGNVQTNTAITNSVGSQGVLPWIAQYGETVGYQAPTIDIQKIHEITRIMDINGCAKQACWLMDIFQRQNFSDGIFKEFPAGAFVWGHGEKSSDANVAYGFENIYIDEYMLQAKKYKPFNTEYTTGQTPNQDFYRNYGVICPMGEARDARDSSKIYKNLTVMYQQPPAGGTIGNGIRVWQHGGGSRNPTDGTMTDNIEMISYRGTRLAAANQFLEITGQ